MGQCFQIATRRRVCVMRIVLGSLRSGVDTGSTSCSTHWTYGSERPIVVGLRFGQLHLAALDHMTCQSQVASVA